MKYVAVILAMVLVAGVTVTVFVLAGSICHIVAVWDVLMEYL